MSTRRQGSESSRFVSRNAKHRFGKGLSSSSSSDEAETVDHKLGSKTTEHHSRNKVGNQQIGQDYSRREENTLSFKHFLKNDSQANYHHTGARPKVYPSASTSPSCSKQDSKVYTRNPTELPDFVQDHLVIEQCYLNLLKNAPTQKPIVDVDNLPDFAQSVEQRQNRLHNEAKKGQSNESLVLPPDFSTVDNEKLQSQDALHIHEHSAMNTSYSGPLDLPTFDRSNRESVKCSHSAGFPLDLPLSINEPSSNANTSTRNGSLNIDASGTKSLPDFLSDGPIRNRSTQSVDIGSGTSPESTERRLVIENGILQQELDITRRQVNEALERIRFLQYQLEDRQDVGHEETAHIEKAMEQAEDNLKRTMKRAINAENTVANLKKEIKELTAEISLLQLENRELRTAICNKNECSAPCSNTDQRIRRLANDLRTAASSAEVSLRQLMSGVDNLRVLASALENVDRIEDRTKDFLPDFDEDSAAGGPAP